MPITQFFLTFWQFFCGFVCFWGSWIRILINHYLYVSGSFQVPCQQKSKKNLDFYYLSTSFWLFAFKDLCTVIVVFLSMIISKKNFKKQIFLLARCQPLMKKAESGSVSQWYRCGSVPKCHGSTTLLFWFRMDPPSFWDSHRDYSSARTWPKALSTHWKNYTISEVAICTDLFQRINNLGLGKKASTSVLVTASCLVSGIHSIALWLHFFDPALNNTCFDR